MLDPHRLSVCKSPVPSKVNHTPGPGTGSQPLIRLGAPRLVAPPVEPATGTPHSIGVAVPHVLLSGTTSR